MANFMHEMFFLSLHSIHLCLILFLIRSNFFFPLSFTPSLLSFSRLEQNLIKSVPAGAFTAYKKLKRM